MAELDDQQNVPEDMKRVPLNVENLVSHVKYLVSQDETELALKALTCIPGYYRDHVPPELKELKEFILGKIYDIFELAKDPQEEPKTDQWCTEFTQTSMRGYVLLEAVREMNKAKNIPHIVDFGPGDFAIPIGLKLLGCEFTYQALNLNPKAHQLARERLGPWMAPSPKNPESKKIFVAYEIIEHLDNPQNIVSIKNKYMRDADVILFSTPKYTFGKGTQKWEENGIHHLRTYTPAELSEWCIKSFPEYSFGLYDNAVMVLKGTRL